MDIREEESDIRAFFSRLKNRDFSGNVGIALKNSIYQFSTTLIGKIGALILTIVLARLLMPEIFGLYSLALSTIIIFVAFSDLGIGDTLVRFVSKELGKRNIAKAKAYSEYLIKIKVFIMLAVSLILILSAKFISENYYHKPLTFALMAGSLYILFGGGVVILQALLQAHNFFKPILYREAIFQILRIIIIPIFVLLSIKNLSPEFLVSAIILILSLSFAISVLLLYVFSKKTIFVGTLRTPKKTLSKKDKTNVKKFVLLNSTIILSGIFFGYIDIVMLGYFVSSEYIGYYQGAFSFINAAISLITFSGALLPIFSRLNKGKMNTFLEKTTKVVSLVSIILFLFIFFAAEPLILTIFGQEYASSINILRILSLLLLSIPITTIYSTYFLSSGKPGVVSKFLVISTIINIILNYLLISYFISHSSLYATYGAAAATIISRYSFMIFLMVYRRRNIKKKN
ncbi:oligosaccharide flippase family protein [Candidatus Pacearchaeota archaeon]|nr:oligosaccharide flippase family protein [Candidatus Pacearchaeota archaeon]